MCGEELPVCCGISRADIPIIFSTILVRKKRKNRIPKFLLKLAFFRALFNELRNILPPKQATILQKDKLQD